MGEPAPRRTGDAGHHVEKIALRDKVVGYCTGCGAWIIGELKSGNVMDEAYAMGTNA